MPVTDKILWVVDYPSIHWFLDRAQYIRSTAVAIRTSNETLGDAVQRFHDAGIRVYGWRWPSAERERCLAEADRAAELLDRGMDGYFVDPEQAPGHHYDWDRPGLGPLATEFWQRVTQNHPEKFYGTTGHFHGVDNSPNLPWAEFFNSSQTFLPQAYWRSEQGSIGHGPARNYRDSLDFWEQTGAERDRIVPMAGELAHATAAEIDAHAAEAASQGRTTLHFYAAEEAVSNAVWDACRNA